MRYLVIFLLLISSAKAQIPAGVLNQGDDPMIVEVRVAGNASGRTAYIYPGGTTDINVDWGDGTSNYYNTSGQKGHTYSSAGTYMIKITGSLQAYGIAYGQGKERVYAIHSWGNLGLVDLSYACYDMSSIEYVPQPPATVTNISYMFTNAYNFNGDISGWDVSNVTHMGGMFSNAHNFNGDISGWDVSNVTAMNSMFQLASNFNSDISGWNVSNVTAMDGMFLQATSFNQDLSGWCVANIPTAPAGFDIATTAWTLPRPVWGTCP